jgi:hypothetical protein
VQRQAGPVAGRTFESGVEGIHLWSAHKHLIGDVVAPDGAFPTTCCEKAGLGGGSTGPRTIPRWDMSPYATYATAERRSRSAPALPPLALFGQRQPSVLELANLALESCQLGSNPGQSLVVGRGLGHFALQLTSPLLQALHLALGINQ